MEVAWCIISAAFISVCCLSTLTLQRGDFWSSGCAMMWGLVEITNWFYAFLKFLFKNNKKI
jgi:hypothetical protein